MSELSSQQISAIAAQLEANPKLQSQFNALFGLKTSDSENPAPAISTAPSTSFTTSISTATDSNAGKKARPERQLEEQDANQRQDVSTSSDIIALVRDSVLPRRVTFTENQYVPNASALFYTLSLMEKIVSKNFRARRAHLAMNPYAHQLYFALLFTLQVARCMKYNNTLSNTDDMSFLDVFLDAFPPEKLAIPGPLLPYFKALTTYRVQNEQFARVTPCFPSDTISSAGNGYTLNSNFCGPLFPHVPVATSMYNQFKTAVTGSPTSSIWHTTHWPFTLDTTNNDIPQHYTAPVTIGGYSFPANRAWDMYASWNLNSPSSRHRTPLQRDYYTNLADNIDDWHAAPTPPQIITNLRTWCSMTQTKWFRSFLAPMSAYSALWIGSGSLADCSVDGPATGAYIHRYQPNSVAPEQPNKAFDDRSLFDLSTRAFTTQGTPEPTTEKIATFTQIHARLSTDHPLNQYLLPARYRDGNVWDARPLYGPSTEDYTYESLEESLRRFLQPNLLK